MEAELREKLQEKLDDYITDTFRDVKTVERFCDKSSRWISEREAELSHLREINTKVKDMDQDDSRRKDLEKELGEVLDKTKEGLEKLHYFLDAVEKLAVTSLFIFMDENFRPHGASHISVITAITSAKIVSPLLLHFKRDAGAFFRPILNNMDTLEFQLNQYILITQQICELMENGSRNLSDAIRRQMNVSEGKHDQISLKKKNVECVEKQYKHLRQLTNIRKDEKFRMCFLFNNETQNFISLFSESRYRMFKFLSELEEAADHLDDLKRSSDNTTVTLSSVSITGGVLSIAGFALAPFTAGLSLGLTAAGVACGISSGVTGITAGISQMIDNNGTKKKANNIFTSFMEDAQKILDCIEVAADTESRVEGPDGVTTLSALKLIKGHLAVARLGYKGFKVAQKIPSIASDLSNIGKLVKGTSLTLSKAAKFAGVNALFIGFDVYCIIDSKKSLAKGSKNETAQIIRDRSVLWRSEVKAWKKIQHHLCNGISEFQKNLNILEQIFNF